MGQKSETDSGFKHMISSTKKAVFENLPTEGELSIMSTFSIDNILPSLPVPDLEKTLQKYLDSVKPQVTEIEYLNTEKIVSKFRNGIGKTLQFHLTERAKNERNWVRCLTFCYILISLFLNFDSIFIKLENWWLDWAYLEWRDPIVPYINTTGYIIGSEVPDELLNKLDQHNIDVQIAKASISIYFYNSFFNELRK